MNITLVAVRNPKWITIKDQSGNPVVKEDGTNFRVIDCECQWSHLGDNTQDWLPFTADERDIATHGKDLYTALVNGDHGSIAAE